MTGADIKDRIDRYIADGTLRLPVGNDLGVPAIDALLDAFFGGALTARVGEPRILESSVIYADSALRTDGFALFDRGESLPAAITFSVSGDAFRLAVDADMPAGYGLADSFAGLDGEASAIAALRLSRAVFTLDSALGARTVKFEATARTSEGLLANVGWMLGDATTLEGGIGVTRGESGALYPEMKLISERARSPEVSGFELDVAVQILTRPVPAPDGGAEPRLLDRAELLAELVTPELTIPIAVALQEGRQRLLVRLDTLRPAPAIDGLHQLAGFTGGEDPSSVLSADTPIGTLSLDWVSIVLDLENRWFSDLQIVVGLGTNWDIIGDRLRLAGLSAAFNAPNLLDPESVSATVTAGIDVVSGRVDAFVSYPDTIVGARLARGSVIDVEDFLRIFASGASLPGESELKIVEFALRADIGQSSYTLACEADGHLAVLPGFVVERLSFAVEYSGGALQQLAFGCLFAIAKTELYLSAAYSPTGWLLAGGTYQRGGPNLSDLVSDMASIFGVKLPADLPEIVLADLQMTRYDTSDGSFAFQAEVDYFAGEDALLRGIVGKVHVEASTDAAGATAWTGGVSGELTLGESVFTVAYDFKTSSRISFSWKALGEETFGIASLCETLGIAPPAIPAGLDLGLRRVDFVYDLGSGSVLLSADSANYGKAVFLTLPVDETREYVFGIDVPLDVRLSDIPLVGHDIPAGDQLGVRDMGLWFVSSPLTRDQADELNRILSTLTGYPTLPDRDITTAIGLFGALILGRDTIELDLPIGSGGQEVAVRAAPVADDVIAPASAAAEDRGGSADPSAPAQADDTRWFTVQRAFGVFSFRRIGVRYETDGSNTLFFVLDASIVLGPLTFSMEGLAVGSPLTHFDPAFQLSGLGLAYDQPPLDIEGAFYAVPERQLSPGTAFQYDGMAVVKATEFSLSAIGSYAQLRSGDPSLFVFAQLESPLGGPPAFFVTGLMGGFGFNRYLALPAQDEVQGFPLLVLAKAPAPGDEVERQDPMKVLAILEGRAPIKPGGTTRRWIEPSPGDYWLAVGLEFTSFKLVETRALLIARFGEDLTFALLGLSTVQLPVPAESAATFAYAELQLEAVVQPLDGFVGLSAVLTENSFVLTPECRLTGGFAFYAWFGSNPHAGQFVVTLGGYHPAFKPPSYFPREPRLGFNWAVSDKVTIKGGAYFALTPSCAMAGGGLEAVYHDGALRAWFTAYADLLVSWRPFFFTARIGVSVGVSYRLNLLIGHKTISVSVSATVEMWGPPTGGKVRVHLAFVSFTVRFGSSGAAADDRPLAWTEFGDLLPNPDHVCRITPVDGLRNTRASEASSSGEAWVVRAGTFRFHTQSAVPASRLRFGDDPVPAVEASTATNAEAPAGPVGPGAADATLHIRPMNRTGAVSTHRLRILREGQTTPIDGSGWTLEPRRAPVPASLWGAPPEPFTQVPDRPTSEVIADQLVGYDIAAPAPALGPTLGVVTLKALSAEYLSPEGRAPVDADADASPDFVPALDHTSVSRIETIMEPTTTTRRRALLEALDAAGLYTGADGSLAVLARDAGRLYSEPPMVQR